MVFLFFRGNPYFKQQMLVKEYPLVEDAAKIRGGLGVGRPGAPSRGWAGQLGCA